jgi:hypothetical protein
MPNGLTQRLTVIADVAILLALPLSGDARRKAAQVSRGLPDADLRDGIPHPRLALAGETARPMASPRFGG